MSYMGVFVEGEKIGNEKRGKRKVIGLRKKGVKGILCMGNERRGRGFGDLRLMVVL